MSKKSTENNTYASAQSGETTYTCAQDIQNAIDEMRKWFQEGNTLPLHYRRSVLERLRSYLRSHEKEALGALAADLGKSAGEAYSTELGIVLDEIRYCLRHLYAWAKPKRVATPLAHFHSSSKIYASPLGVCAILAPWNYPLQLALVPLVDAICAGNCVMLKPSRTSVATNAFLQELCASVFDRNLVRCLPAGAKINEWILTCHFDKLFFTGSPRTGRQIMHAAAQNLTDVTLELGGKSPCIVAADANIKRAAQRIAWGKGINCGQTCVAPDYLLVHESVAKELIGQLKSSFESYYGRNPLACEHYPRIINERHFLRVCNLIDNRNANAQLAFGGGRDAETLKIEPCVITGVTLEDPIMQEEIFGPVLPLITWQNTDEIFSIIRSYPAPLACYIFSENRIFQQQIIANVQFGGAAINDVVIHLANNHMGFGGVGESGLGSYHGKAGFDCFTHYKSTIKKGTWLEPTVRVPPYTKAKLSIIRLLMR